MAKNRKSMGHSSTPRAGDFDLLKTIKERTARMLKSTINASNKLDNEANVSTLCVVKDDLDMKWDEYRVAFEELEAALVGAAEHDDITTITNEYVQYNTEFLKTKAHIRKLIADTVDEPDDSLVYNADTHEPIERTSFKLAPMRIANFSGNLSEWIEFKATCQAVLVDSMPEIQRLQHLKDALMGEARMLVSHILPGDGAYNRAMSLLKNRYENTRAIINGHLQKFYLLPSMDYSNAEVFRDMLNTVNGLIAVLDCCDIDTCSWDSILIFHLSQRFDRSTLEAWEEKLGGNREIPKLKILLAFLESRIIIAESSDTFVSASKPIDKSQKQGKLSSNQRSSFENRKMMDKQKAFFTLKPTFQCVLCKENHLPSRCTDLSKRSTKDRHALITRHKLCVNCFYPHNVSDCPFESACRKCSEPHHTLLHFDSKQTFLTVGQTTDVNENGTDDAKENDESDTMSTISEHHFYHINNESEDDTLLATAIVPARANGRSVLLKSLLDQGSTSNVITINACDLLRLKFNRIETPMIGLGNSPVGNVIGRTVFEIGSIHDSSYRLLIRAIVVQSIGGLQGFDKNELKNWSHLRDLKLADPEYHSTGKIDLLLGGAAYADFILDGVIKGSRHQPIAQNTRLGWIMSGNVPIAKENLPTCRYTSFEDVINIDDDLNALLKQFWEIEEPYHQRLLTDEEKLAEETFQRSMTRATDGKFIVDLPFKLDPFNSLGESFKMAMKRYVMLQRKFDKNPQLKTQYDAILEEYLTLNHMELVADNSEFHHFLPHHHVTKESSTTTKIRTVFDGSAKSSTGISLNDCLCVGPNIQPDLFDLLINWRKFEFAISADIEKMYRMIYVNTQHANLQSIIWHRPGTTGPAVYRLLTVTFGTSSAAFQSTRALYEIGERIKTHNKALAEIIQRCFYVDDFLKSFPTVCEAQQIRTELTHTLADYGFNLRKWKSNSANVLEGIDDKDKEECIDFDSVFKTLGIAWQADSDAFIFKCLHMNDTDVWTKRKVLSATAKLYDPLGWLAPYIVRAKILMQNIWRDPNGADWDAPLPNHLITEWRPIFTDLTKPIEIKIPRWIGLSNQQQQVEIHAFCDASNSAYACSVYVRTICDDHTSCHLIAAKTRVAPLRAITIPRLELCGALLLSKLTIRCIEALCIDNFRLFAWCDSKIVLAWLATHPNKWTPFVANRVSEIQQKIDSNCWRYIRSKQNPADLASRGCSMSDLKFNAMWLHGPEFLLNSSKPIPSQEITLPIENAPEKRKTIKVFHVIEPKPNYILSKFESHDRLLHFTCLAYRWLNRARSKTAKTTTTTENGPITADEMQCAESHWIKLTQQKHFGQEIGRIKANRNLPFNSALRKLAPFVDDEGYLRMNGRVKNADLLAQKMSVILPSKSKLVTLIIRHAHEQQTLHGGVQLTVRTLRERFWIVHARSQVAKLIGHCVLCYCMKKRLLKQRMADLPSFRTEQTHPFTFVGCDYAGPFDVKMNDNRNSSCSKGYIALFMCLTTKAIHLELACNQSMEEFIMAFENFIARRGIPTVFYSDNAGNFTSAEKEIHSLQDQLLSQMNDFTRMLASKRITFKRIPANAPHMGGIWERAVGLIKYHLKRVMKHTKLTHRRFDHVLKQIECCVNSRPLWAMTPDADGIEVITPSHFFNFKPINSLPRPDLSHLKLNQLCQYQHLHRLYTDFWRGWSKEYLDQLQPRQKWHDKHPNEIEIGHIVVVSDDNTPPSRWPLGRITKVFPASDGVIRCVEVKVGNNKWTRPIHRLGILPIIDNEILSHSGEQPNAGQDVV